MSGAGDGDAVARHAGRSRALPAQPCGRQRGGALLSFAPDTAMNRVDIFFTVPSTDGLSTPSSGRAVLEHPGRRQTSPSCGSVPTGGRYLSLPATSGIPGPRDRASVLRRAASTGSSRWSTPGGTTTVRRRPPRRASNSRRVIGLVDELGGTSTSEWTRSGSHDRHVGSTSPHTPCTTLDGEHTLGLLRSRWTEVQAPDAQVDTRPDRLGRIARARPSPEPP